MQNIPDPGLLNSLKMFFNIIYEIQAQFHSDLPEVCAPLVTIRDRFHSPFFLTWTGNAHKLNIGEKAEKEDCYEDH